MSWLPAPPPTRTPRELKVIGPPVTPVTRASIVWVGITCAPLPSMKVAVTRLFRIAAVTVTDLFRFIADSLAKLSSPCSSVVACFNWAVEFHRM